MGPTQSGPCLSQWAHLSPVSLVHHLHPHWSFPIVNTLIIISFLTLLCLEYSFQVPKKAESLLLWQVQLLRGVFPSYLLNILPCSIFSHSLSYYPVLFSSKYSSMSEIILSIYCLLFIVLHWNISVSKAGIFSILFITIALASRTVLDI